MKEIIITSSILICAVLLLRFLFRGKVSRRLIYASWLLVALRLLIPVQLGQFSFSVLNQVENVTGIMDNVAKEPVSGASREEIYQDVLEDYVSSGTPVFIPEIQDKIDIALPDFSFDEIYDSLPEKGEDIILPQIKEEIEVKVQQSITVPTLGQIAKTIWILGMGAMLIWFAGVNILFNRKLKKASETIEIANSPVPVKISPLLSSPCLFGFLKPTVYLTHNCREDGQIRRHVLTHELTHWKHKDHIWSLVRCVCLCVYWFNPLVWVAAFVSKRDCELACDEAVLKQLGESERLTYGKTLVDMVATNPTAANLLETATAMHETKKALKERVNHIVKKKKHLLISALCLILVLSIVAGCSFTGKKDNTPTTDPSDPTGTTEPSGTTAPPETTVPSASGSWETNGENDVNLGYQDREEIRDWVIEENSDEITGKVRVLAPSGWTLAIADMIEAFNKDYPNIEVEVVQHYWSNPGDSKLNVVLKNGEADVIFSQGINATMVRKESGLLKKLEDTVFSRSDFPDIWNCEPYNIEGFYFLPCAGTQYYIAINYDAWQEAGLGELPTAWTWDEYLYACEKMTKVNEDGSIRYGGSMDASCNTALYSYTQVYGKDMFYAPGGIQSSLSDPIVLNALERQLQAELNDKYWYPVIQYIEEGKKARDAYLNGEVASIIATDLTNYLAYIEEQPQVDWITAFAPFPTEEKGQTNYMSGVHPDTYVAIAANCQDETAAWMFTKWASVYGGNYLAIRGQFSNCRMTKPDDIVNAIFGTHKRAKDIIDTTSFKWAVGRTTAPTYREKYLTEFTSLSRVHNSYFKDALRGKLTAEEALTQAAQAANAILYQNIYEIAFKNVRDYGYEGEEGKYLAALCYQDIDKFLDYVTQIIDPSEDSVYIQSDYRDYRACVHRYGTNDQREDFNAICLTRFRDPNSSFQVRYTASFMVGLSSEEDFAMRYEALESHTEIEFEATAVFVEELDPAYLPMWRPDGSIYTSYESLVAHQKRIKELGENGAYDGTVTSELSPKSHDEVIKQYDEDFFEDYVLFEVLIEVEPDTTKVPSVQKVTTGEPCYWMDRFCVFLEYDDYINNQETIYDLYVVFIAVPREYYKEPIGINDYEFAFNCCVNGVPFQPYG